MCRIDIEIFLCHLQGDSGGPLFIKEADGKYTQIGITSFGASGDCYKYPSGFTRVTSFMAWMKTNVAGLTYRA
jgi:secreted trypsin-like serine protease